MIESPFQIFAPFQDRFSVRFFTKADSIATDQDLSRHLQSSSIASLTQVHGNRTVFLKEPSSRIEQADAILTDQPDLWLSVRAADCQQLIVYVPKLNICGVIHAGWKGLKAEIIHTFLKELKETHAVRPADIFVGIGPSLCETCAEFTNPYEELEGLNTLFFNGKNANLCAIADSQLDQMQIPRSNRERMADCTKCMHATYWSYRGGDKEKVAQGWCNVFAIKLSS